MHTCAHGVMRLVGLHIVGEIRVLLSARLIRMQRGLHHAVCTLRDLKESLFGFAIELIFSPVSPWARTDSLKSYKPLDATLTCGILFGEDFALDR